MGQKEQTPFVDSGVSSKHEHTQKKKQMEEEIQAQPDSSFNSFSHEWSHIHVKTI